MNAEKIFQMKRLILLSAICDSQEKLIDWSKNFEGMFDDEHASIKYAYTSLKEAIEAGDRIGVELSHFHGMVEGWVWGWEAKQLTLPGKGVK